MATYVIENLPFTQLHHKSLAYIQDNIKFKLPKVWVENSNSDRGVYMKIHQKSQSERY